MTLHSTYVKADSLESNEEEPSTPLLLELESNSVSSDNPRVFSAHSISISNTTSSNHMNQQHTHWNEKEQRQWTILLYLGTIMVYATRTIMPLVAVRVAEEFKWDKTDLGLVLGCFFWGYPVFQIIGGHLSDKIGGDLVMYRAALVWSTICLLTPSSAYVYQSKTATVYMMALLRFLMGLTQGVHFPSLTSVVSSRVNPSDKALVLTIVLSAGAAGAVFTGGVGSILLEEFHWSMLFYCFGALSLIWALCVRACLKKTKKTTSILHEPLTHLDRNFVHKTTGVKSQNASSFPARQVFTKAPFWGLFIAWICSGYCNLTLLSWLPTYFTETFPGHKGWVFNVLPWLIQIPSGILSGYLSGKLIGWGYEKGLARKIIFTVCSICLVVPLILVSFTSSYNIALFLIVFAQAGTSFNNGALPVNIQDIAPSQAGAVFGIVNTGAAIQGFLGSYITGYILHLTESWAIVFCSTAAIYAFGWTAFVKFASGNPIL